MPAQPTTIKYENAILYLCQRSGGAIHDKKKLAKLLYYIDFDRYEYKESMRSITGDQYEHWQMGPVPKRYVQIIETLEKTGKLERQQIENSSGYHPTETFLCKSASDVSGFDADDILIMDRVIKMYGALSGKQLETLTHQEAPYVATEPNEIIPYELAFYRETDFSDVVADAR